MGSRRRLILNGSLLHGRINVGAAEERKYVPVQVPLLNTPLGPHRGAATMTCATAILAQLVEQRFCKPQVEGSSPSDGLNGREHGPPDQNRSGDHERHA